MPRLLIDAVGAAVPVELDGLDEAAIDAVREAWRDAVLDTPGDRVVARAVAPASGDLEALLSTLSQQVTLAAIDARAGELWMLHAAGLAAPDGRVIVLVGPSGRGKTTAARGLGEHFGYVSDETVGIGADGIVHPYRKPLSIIERADSYKAQRAPSSLGLRELPAAPLRLAAVVLLERPEEPPASAELETLDLGDALAELVAQTSYLAKMTAPLETIAAHAERTGGLRRVTYGSVESLLPVFEELLAHPAPPATAPVEPLAPLAATGFADDDAERFSRADVLDAVRLADPDRVAVIQLHGDAGAVRVLAGIAPAVWGAADAATLAELEAAAIAEYGEPDGADAAQLVAAAVDALLDSGVLERVGWEVPASVAWTERPDRVVALAMDGADLQPRVLEGSAALIWRAVAEGRATTAEIVGRVARAADVEPEVVAADVAAFLSELRAAGLLVRR